MARIRTIGFEVAVPTGLESGAFDGWSTGTTAVTLDTATKRSGAKSAKCAGGASTTSYLSIAYPVNNLPTQRFHRIYVRFTALPNATKTIGQVEDPVAGVQARVRLTSGGKLQLWDISAQIGSDSVATLAINTWYRVELYLSVSTGAFDTAQLYLDGTLVADSGAVALSENSPRIFRAGWIEAPGVVSDMYLDDFAVNDQTGIHQNSFAGDGKIVLLRPISDSQRGSWTGGAGGTTNLWDALNNTPPIGTASETNLTQIESIDTSGDNTTDEYRANLETYTTGGIVSGDTITVLQPVVNNGEDVSTGTKTGKFGLVSNPADSSGGGTSPFTFNDSGALGTWPTAWKTDFGVANYAPSVTLGTSPVLAVRKTDTGSRVASVDFLGLYVEYVPSAGPPAGAPRTLATLGVGT